MHRVPDLARDRRWEFAFIGVPLYMIAQDRFAQADPVYWDFWIGLLLIIVVLFARSGVLGLLERLLRRISWLR